VIDHQVTQPAPCSLQNQPKSHQTTTSHGDSDTATTEHVLRSNATPKSHEQNGDDQYLLYFMDNLM
jgi:hypothetical protein